MKFFLKTKHWILFLLMVAPVIFLNVGLPLPFPFVFGVIFLFFMLILLGWFYSIAIASNDRLDNGLKKNTKVLKISLTWSVVYVFLTMIFLAYPDKQELPILLTAVIPPMHLAAMFGIFYSFWFAAKQFTSLKMKKRATFRNYIGLFFGFWFCIFGVWFIQPQINRYLGQKI